MYIYIYIYILSFIFSRNNDADPIVVSCGKKVTHVDMVKDWYKTGANNEDASVTTEESKKERRRKQEPVGEEKNPAGEENVAADSNAGVSEVASDVAAGEEKVAEFVPVDTQPSVSFYLST